jgi:pimeloyl-ACP methyl ester carboxylesterase
MRTALYFLVLLTFFSTLMGHDARVPHRPLITLFAHGLGGKAENARWYSGESSPFAPFFTASYISFNFPDIHSTEAGNYLRHRANAGQLEDMVALEKEILMLIEQGYDIVCFGVSRGAMTLINLLAHNHDLAPFIKAVVLESPSTSVKDTVRYALMNAPILQSIPKPVLKTATTLIPDAVIRIMLTSYYLKKYNDAGPHPLESATRFPTNIPVLIVQSEDDQFVPAIAAKLLSERLANTGNHHVYVALLKQGQHGKYTLDASKHEYRDCVHYFYELCNLPHNSYYAAGGKLHLKQTLACGDN